MPTRWPGLKKDRQIAMHKGYLNFEDLINARVKCKKELPHLLAQMNEKYYHTVSNEYLQDLDLRNNQFSNLYRAHYFHLHDERNFLNNIFLDKKELTLLVYPNKTTHNWNYYLVMDELTSLNERWKNGYKDDLTNIYYGRNLLTYLRHHYLENVWEEFINHPPEHQLLEEVINFIMQWLHPEKNVSCSYIEMDLENIAQQVMKHLKVVNSDHPIFSTSREQFSRWKCNNIYKNQWNNSDGRQIIDILFNILLYKPTFDTVVHSLKSDLFRQYLYISKDGYMNNVPLPVIFQSVTRRLGIYCDLVSLFIVDPDIMVFDSLVPNNWLLRWKPKCNITNSNDEQCLYIHLGGGGTILNKNNLPIINFCTLECPISFNRHSKINLLQLMITLADDYLLAMKFSDKYHTYHSRMCNDSDPMFEEDHWRTRFLHLVKECLSNSQSRYMRGRGDVFKFVDELEKVPQ
ncbi:uncharacterized protein LOC113561497 [Ooceraea biroi]|uniref:uncharacterized protein LOC113561497 n=1 Tax=Ooceraea biroi TaxID=2015173 RepID=UPI000F099A61|nr:uncharacterized protein LOC113561497 [Ooceraea biroi]